MFTSLHYTSGPFNHITTSGADTVPGQFLKIEERLGGRSLLGWGSAVTLSSRATQRRKQVDENMPDASEGQGVYMLGNIYVLLVPHEVS